MKGTLFLLLAIGCALPIRAQQKQTIYYENGQKFMEGRWTYAINSPLSTSLLQTLLLGRERWRDATDDYAGDLPDADFVLGRKFDEEDPATTALLSLVCEGPVTVWYRSGAKRAEVLFKNGVASGPFIVYYPSGKVMAKGVLSDGMPDGVLTMWYESGAISSTGTYTPYTQAELAAEWQNALFENGRYSRYNREEDTFEDLLEREFNDTSRSTAAARVLFSRIAKLTPGHGKRNGDFIFYYADGRKRAHLTYASNKRSGDWMLWGTRKTPTYVLHYGDGGRLTAVTDSTGKRRAIGDHIAHWLRTSGERPTPGHGADTDTEAPGIIDQPVDAAAPGTGTIYSFVDVMPAFPGDVRAYFSKHLRYPEKARRRNIQGQVVVQFVVGEDGSLSNIKVVRGIGGGCDEEALRVVRSMPRWKPGKQNGQPVKTVYSLPITFRLR